MTAAAHCLSTKTWEGDYRRILQPDGIGQIFGSLGPATRRQVILNRIGDRTEAAQMADRLVRAGVLDEWAWADEMWPSVSRGLHLPESWFGAAWPYSVPELCELALAGALPIVHLAGDVRFDAPPGWAAQALGQLGASATAAVVTATPPAGREWVLARADTVSEPWATTTLFSDQLFVARATELLSHDVMTAVHPAAARYPKPGGALTFEARVGAWLASSGRTTLVDTEHGYAHPVWGSEGDSYHWDRGADCAPVPPEPSRRYPPRLAGTTGLIVSNRDERTVGAAVASLAWCERLLVVDAAGWEPAQLEAKKADAEVLIGPTAGGPAVARRWGIEQTETDWVVCLEGNEVCPPELARRLAEVIGNGRADLIEASRRSLVAGKWREPEYTLLAFRPAAVVFGRPLDEYALSPTEGRTVERISDSSGAEILRLESPDVASSVAQLNARSSQRALSLVVERKPTLRMPLRRFVRAWLGGHDLRGAILEGVEEWLTLEKWDEAWRGGGVATTAMFEQLAWAAVSEQELQTPDAYGPRPSPDRRRSGLRRWK